MTDDNHNLDDLRKKYKAFLNNKKLEDLEKELRKPNIFSILGIGRMEIRHSNFLAWLLDPNGSHGLGNRFLIRILRDLALDDKNKLDIFKINELNFSNVEINREVAISLKDKDKDKDGSIDILIVFRDEKDKLVICIENKIDATDSDGQLEKYRTYIEGTFKEEESDEGYKNVFVYLTPDKTDIEKEVRWINYTYEDGIIKHLEHIQETITDSIIKTYISDYLSILKSEIMKNKETDLEKMANAIFDKHKDVFKFVFDNKSNELYKLDWERYHWVITCATKFKGIIKEIDPKIDDELGYTKGYISVKRNKQICYWFVSREKEPQCAMSFSKDKIDKKLLGELEKVYKPQKCNKSEFVLPNVNEFVDNNSELVKEIHRIRFPKNNPNNQ